MVPTNIFKFFIAAAAIAPVISLPLPAGPGEGNAPTPSQTHAKWVYVQRYFMDINELDTLVL